MYDSAQFKSLVTQKTQESGKEKKLKDLLKEAGIWKANKVQ